MSKQRALEIDGFKLFFQEYGIEDLVAGIEVEGMSKEQIQDIALEFYKMMCEDLILNNNCFYLPERDFGMISVKDISNIDNKEYVYDFVNEGKVLQPVVRSKTRPYIYMARFTGSTKELFDKEVLNQHHY